MEKTSLQKVKIYISPFWSIGELLDVNNVPLEMLEEGERRLRDTLRRRVTMSAKKRKDTSPSKPSKDEDLLQDVVQP